MNPVDAEKLILAMVSTYVWVASSDGEVDLLEYNKFKHLMVESPFATQFTEDNMRHTFKDMVSVFETDYDYGIKLSRQRIAEYADQPVMSGELLRLAKGAIVADLQIKDVEEIVYAEVVGLLKLDAENV